MICPGKFVRPKRKMVLVLVAVALIHLGPRRDFADPFAKHAFIGRVDFFATTASW